MTQPFVKKMLFWTNYFQERCLYNYLGNFHPLAFFFSFERYILRLKKIFQIHYSTTCCLIETYISDFVLKIAFRMCSFVVVVLSDSCVPEGAEKWQDVVLCHLFSNSLSFSLSPPKSWLFHFQPTAVGERGRETRAHTQYSSSLWILLFSLTVVF